MKLRYTRNIKVRCYKIKRYKKMFQGSLQSQQHCFRNYWIRLKNGITLANDLSGGPGPNNGGGDGSNAGGTSSSIPSGPPVPSLSTTTLSLDHQQFNIFPAIFSRQLNFSAAAAAANCGTNQNKLMDDLRPNLGLLGVNLMENENFHFNHNQDKRKCNTSSSNEHDFSLYAVHQSLDSGPPTPATTPVRNSISSASTGG